MIRYIFLVWFSLLLLFSCSKDGDNANSTQTYNIEVVNGLSNEPIADVGVNLSWNFGSQNFDFSVGTTDANGMVSIVTNVNIDSVNSLIDTFDNASPNWVHQNINVVSDDYVYYECVQDTAMRIFRSMFVENELITVKVHDITPFKFTIVDVPPLRDKDYLIWAEFRQFHPAFSFDYSGFSFHGFTLGDPDSETVNLRLADAVDYRIDFILTEFDTLNQVLDTISVTPISFKGTDGEIVYEF